MMRLLQPHGEPMTRWHLAGVVWMMTISCSGHVLGDMNMSTYMEESPLRPVLWAEDTYDMTMGAYMQSRTSYRNLDHVLTPGGTCETAVVIVESYAGIDDMPPNEAEVSSQNDALCTSKGRAESWLNELTQTLRRRGTDIFPECDYPDTEDILNRILIWEISESRQWPDLTVSGDVRIYRKLKRKPRVIRGCFDPASYAHLDDHCLYAVMFRSLTGHIPPREVSTGYDGR